MVSVQPPGKPTTIQPTTQSPMAEAPEFDYGQLLHILRRRILWFGGGFLGAIGLAAIAAVLQPPAYQSSMQLLVEPNVTSTFDLNAREGNQPNSFSETEVDYATQLNLMRSGPLIERAMALIEARHPGLCAEAESRTDCVEEFRESLSLYQVEEGDAAQTRIFEAVFTSDDPLRTQKSLEALRNVYLAYNLEQQKQRLNEGLELVNQQIDEVQGSLSESQQALRQFRQGENLIDPEQQSSSAMSALDELEQNQQQVQADYQEAIAQYEALQQSLSLNPQQAVVAARLSESERYQTLLNALQTSELALAERLATYTPSDPVAQDLQAKRDLQVSLLRQESGRLVGSARGDRAEALVSDGQLGAIDLALVQEMIAAQIQIRSLAARQNSLAQTEQSLQQKLNDYPRLIAEYDRLQPEVETQRSALEQLLETRQELINELAQGGFKWIVVEPPNLGQEVSPSLAQTLLLGGVAGIFIGGVLAYGREALDTVVRTSEDIKRQTSLPLLGVLPELSEPASKYAFITPAKTASAFDLSSLLDRVQREPFREAVDLIYKNIQLGASSLRSVMVTSAVAGEGKTLLAVGLALSAARSQKRVLLIDADLRNPSVHRQLGLSETAGLTTLLTSVDMPSPVAVALAGTHIDILPAGPLTDDPVRLLNAHPMKSLIGKFERQYDLIVFDTSAVLGRVDALQVASLCQGVVMVSRLDQITQADLAQATATLSQVGALGIVANSSRSPAVGYGLRSPTKAIHSNGASATAASN